MEDKLLDFEEKVNVGIPLIRKISGICRVIVVLYMLVTYVRLMVMRNVYEVDYSTGKAVGSVIATVMILIILCCFVTYQILQAKKELWSNDFYRGDRLRYISAFISFLLLCSWITSFSELSFVDFLLIRNILGLGIIVMLLFIWIRDVFFIPKFLKENKI